MCCHHGYNSNFQIKLFCHVWVGEMTFGSTQIAPRMDQKEKAPQIQLSSVMLPKIHNTGKVPFLPALVRLKWLQWFLPWASTLWVIVFLLTKTLIIQYIAV